MSANIPPLVSSSPPPLCDSDDDEEEDDNEFGMFTVAEELEYNDCMSFPATNDNKIHLSESATNTRGTEQDSMSQDSTTDSGLCPDSEGSPHSDDERTEVVKIRSCKRLQENPSPKNYENKRYENGNCDNLGTVRNNIHRSVEPPEHKNVSQTQTLKCSDINSEPVLANCNDLSISVEHCSSINPCRKCESQETEILNDSRASSQSSINSSVLPVDGDNSDLDKGNEITDLILDPISSTVDEQIEHNSQQDTSEVTDSARQVQDSDDTFGDFQFEPQPTTEVFSVPPEAEAVSDIVEADEEVEEFAEFSQFADFSNSNCDVVINSKENTNVSLPQDKEEREQKSEPFQVSANECWNGLFPIESSSESSQCSAITVESSPIWRKLCPIETSPALTYQWSNSHANKQLLSALNIDSRNILFMPWCNMSVPRFAANLGFGPLEPVRSSEPVQPVMNLSLSTSTSTCEETVPEAHFDWVSSGLTNPLDCDCSTICLCTVLCFIRCLVMVMGQLGSLLFFILTFSPHLIPSNPLIQNQVQYLTNP